MTLLLQPFTLLNYYFLKWVHSRFKALLSCAQQLQCRYCNDKLKSQAPPTEQHEDMLRLYGKVVFRNPHRITGQVRGSTAPWTFIVKGQLVYRNNKIRFHPDLSAEVHKQQWEFYEARKRVRKKGIDKYQIISPAKLLVSDPRRTHTLSPRQQLFTGLLRDCEKRHREELITDVQRHLYKLNTNWINHFPLSSFF